MKYVVQDLQLTRAQRGIIIEAWVSVPTARQCTNEYHLFKNTDFDEIEPSLSTVVALYRMWKGMRRRIRALQSIEGSFDLDGSCFHKGIGLN